MTDVSGAAEAPPPAPDAPKHLFRVFPLVAWGAQPVDFTSEVDLIPFIMGIKALGHIMGPHVWMPYHAIGMVVEVLPTQTPAHNVVSIVRP